jgi:hypothetical protein
MSDGQQSTSVKVEWLDVATTAKRLDRCKGHIRKIAPALAARGLARKQRHGAPAAAWFIRSDFQIDQERPEIVVPAYVGAPIVVSAGELLITIESTGDTRVVIESAYRAGKGSNA